MKRHLFVAMAVTLAVMLGFAGCDGADPSGSGDDIAGVDGVSDAAGAPDAAPDDAATADAAAPDAAADAAVDVGETLPPVSDPAAPGPWVAGVRTIALTDPARERTIPVDVWYPVDPTAPDGEDNEYALDIGIAVLGRFGSAARRDATPAAPTSGVPWPLVVFSHGFGGVRFQSAFLCEHLATHGFVVAAPDHVGNTVGDFAQLNDDEAVDQSSVDRPLDVMLVRDAIVADPAWGVDPARVAISGHSFGGWTAVETAARDEGFRVVVALAPGFLHGSVPQRAADVQRPLAIFAGTNDRTTPLEEHQRPAFEAAAAPKLLVVFEGAGHFDFTHLCEIPAAKPIYEGDGCDPALRDWTTVFAQVNTAATAFLRLHLDGDPRYAEFLTTERLTAPGGVAVDRAD